VELDTLAIDREFDEPEYRLDGIISDINKGNFPTSRFNELLHENLFEDEYGVKKHQTFLSYACTKLDNKNLESLLMNFENVLGKEQFSKYLELEVSNGVVSGNIFNLYLDDNGLNN